MTCFRTPPLFDAPLGGNPLEFLNETYPTNTRKTGLDGWMEHGLRPRQHRIGCMGDGFYRPKDPTNSIKELKEMYGATVR